ncbi:MAG: serine/threonine-protein kinase [Nannocystaceae bacterium]
MTAAITGEGDDDERMAATCEARLSVLGRRTASAADTLAVEPREDAPELGRGEVIGRYVVLSRLGAGGMGVVYAGYDPELDRKIALKLLRPANLGPDDAHRTRLLREAQALAKLSHPNVVGVFDVGTLGDRIWLAMEYVDGMTLGTWRKEQPRSWSEIVDVMIAAGRGIAAAHAAGLVHRDIKPDNLMIGPGSRVRVMDFGLAFAAGAAIDDDEPVPLSSSEFAVLAVRVTLAGSILGTPAYMAPECLRGVNADARSDLYSFTATLWEAIYDQAPFVGESFSELRTHVVQGAIRPPPADARVPAWLRRALDRGLTRDPAARFPSMDALLDHLEAGRARVRGGRRLGAVAGLAIAASLIAGARGLDRQARVAGCEAAGASISAVWDPAARDRLRADLVATGAADAAATYTRMVPWIDRWTAEWSSTRAAVCRRAEVDGDWPAELHERARACLDARQAALVGLQGALADAPPQAIWSAVTGAAALPSPAPCGDRALLERLPTPPPEKLAQVGALAREHAAVVGLEDAGRYAEALARAEPLAREAAAVGYRPLSVRVDAQIAGLRALLGDLQRGEEALTQVFVDAGALGLDDVAVDAANRQIFNVGYLSARQAEGLLWARAAEMLLRRLGEEDQPRGASVKSSLANLHYARGDLEASQRLFEEALAINQRSLGENHPILADNLTNLADVHYARGDFDRARALYEQSLALSAATLGAIHPNRAVALNNLGNLHLARGENEVARLRLQEALDVFTATLGHDHPNLASTIENLADLDRIAGDEARAEAGYRRALALVEGALGPEHPALAGPLAGLAELARRRGDRGEAERLLRSALRLREAALGPEHADVAALRTQLARLDQDAPPDAAGPPT